MAARNDESLLFVAEWFDPMPQMKKQYLLKYWPDQHMAEMVDLKNKKIFLKKSPCPAHSTRDDFYVGGKIVLYSRELDIVDYGDLKTKEKLHHQVQQCALLLPPTSYSHWGKIIDALQQTMALVQLQTIIVSPNIADKICQVLDLNPRKAGVISEGVSLALMFHGDDGFSKVRAVVDKFAASKVDIFAATNGLQSSELSPHLLDPQQGGSTATLDSCTCCVIKPHAVKARHVGMIIDDIIAQGYEISAARSLMFEKVAAEEFYEVYKGVVPEYPDHVVQLATGLSVAMELRAQNAVETFRVTAGPWDVEMAKDLHPGSLRAKFGIDRVLNGVHCTDLPEDGPLECEYCFKLM